MNTDSGKRRRWIIEQPRWRSSKSRDSSGAGDCNYLTGPKAHLEGVPEGVDVFGKI